MSIHNYERGFMDFINIASGSKGNCTVVATKHTTVMIDDGLNIRTLTERARLANIDLSKINAILVTHEHSDHIKGLASLASKYSIPVYCHKESRDGLDIKVFPYLTDTDMDKPFEIGDIEINPFRLPHDSNYNLGYRLTDKKHSVTLATDLGCMNDAIFSNLQGSDLVMLESNHDIQMLKSGSYPFLLKQRILSKNGHLSNDDCADTICKLSKTGTKHFVLAHLSQDNNTPELAFECTQKALGKENIKEGLDAYVDIAMQYRTMQKIHLD